MTMRYADTLRLISRLPELRPAASLSLRLNALFDQLHTCTDPARAAAPATG